MKLTRSQMLFVGWFFLLLAMVFAIWETAAFGYHWYPHSLEEVLYNLVALATATEGFRLIRKAQKTPSN